MKSKVKNIIVTVLFAVIIGAGFLLCLFVPKETYSESERRKLAQMPAFTKDAVFSGRFTRDFESYTLDGFPFRDAWRRIKAETNKNVFFRQDNNVVYEADGFLSALQYPMNEESLDHAVSRFRYFADKYLGNANHIYVSVIPDKNAFLAAPSGHPAMDYPLFEKTFYEKMDFATPIVISDLLERDDYYFTDTHWRQERIPDVADRLASGMGATLTGTYTEKTLDRGFYGVYYGQAALPMPPEEMHYLTNDILEGAVVHDLQNNREISVYDMERAHGTDPYEMFLGGPLSLVTIENPAGPEGKRLVIFRDSFGSSITPLLLSGYSEIVLCDTRYVQPDVLGKMVDFEGADVLYLYSTMVLNNSEMLK